ncbi:uncharacterized protein [Rutidosis leptorrhynchoides]|uniref:uncharacterized protein n=1 Tax=Rutidosis leptorrhynchoides TaxID=125765 RepID=UPI003A9A214F
METLALTPVTFPPPQALPISPSPSSLSSQQSCSSFVNNGHIFNEQQQEQQAHSVLNMSPRPSSLPVVNSEMILHDRTSVWSESEMTPCFASLSSNAYIDSPNAKSSLELVKEITSIEIEILRLERYLLSLYRTAYQHNTETNEMRTLRKTESNTLSIADKPCDNVKKISDSNDHSHVSIAKSLPKSVNRSRVSLGDHLIGTSCTDGAHLGGPDRLSEDILRCICSIYSKLGDPNQCHQGPSDSSGSSLSSSSTISTQNISDTWSPCCNEEKGPYAEMIEVLKIGLDDDSFDYASKMLKHFRTLIKKLENVDPGKMKREQNLAFWINIHNALVMHAHLAYGTHNNSRTNSILKATYNVGGQCINAYTIQSSILGIRSHFRASWLQSLLSPGKKLSATPNRHVYAIEYPEPLVHFALSLGSFSDPAVRIYKAKNVFQDLRVAKEEFIRSTVYIHKESKIYVPKILYYYAKDVALTVSGLFEMVNACLPKSQQQAIERSVKGKPEKYFCWLSQSSIFRYVIHRDAVERRLLV